MSPTMGQEARTSGGLWRLVLAIGRGMGLLSEAVVADSEVSEGRFPASLLTSKVTKTGLL